MKLICPHDKELLTETRDSGFDCSQCGRHYPVEDGVVRVLEKPDEFYEGAYEGQIHFLPQSERLWHVWPLWLINSGYLWTVRRFVQPGAVVAELGCAGGVCYFGQRYRMIGCDLSFYSLKKLGAVYERRVQADAAQCIPLSDCSVDAVVSAYLWEHISPGTKPKLLAECHRILRPGGTLIFLYDVETENPLILRYKRINLPLYKKLFLEGDGHFGYQRPGENIAIFERAEFRVIEHRGMEKTCLQGLSVYPKLAQFGTRRRYLLAKAVRLNPRPLLYLYCTLMRLIDTLICPWLPTDWARIDLTVCRIDLAGRH